MMCAPAEACATLKEQLIDGILTGLTRLVEQLDWPGLAKTHQRHLGSASENRHAMN